MSWPQTRNPGRPERQAKKKLSPLWHFHSADFVRTRSQDFNFPPLCTCSRFSDSCCCLSTFLFCFRHSSLGKVNKNKALSVGVSVCPCVCVCVCVWAPTFQNIWLLSKNVACVRDSDGHARFSEDIIFSISTWLRLMWVNSGTALRWSGELGLFGMSENSKTHRFVLILVARL